MWVLHENKLKKIGIKSARDLYDIHYNIKASGLVLNEIYERSNGHIPEILTRYYGTYKDSYVQNVRKYMDEINYQLSKIDEIIELHKEREKNASH